VKCLNTKARFKESRLKRYKNVLLQNVLKLVMLKLAKKWRMG